MVTPEFNDDCTVATLAPELFFSIISFVDGRALSSFVEALLASKSRRSCVGPLMEYLVTRWHDEIVQVLSHNRANPQPALLLFVKEQMLPRLHSMALAENNAHLMGQFSEWCILFDYVLQGPRSASADRMVWPVGVGVFATSPICGGNVPLQTKVVVHCPVWNPIAVLLCHDIWSSKKRVHEALGGAPSNFSWLPSEGDIDGFLPDENIGFLTPFDDNQARTFCATQALTRDDDFLPAMGRPDCCLSILPALDCPIYGSLIDHLLQSSRRHAWMLEEGAIRPGTGKPGMLCFFDIHPNRFGAADTSYSGTPLVDRIVDLMKNCQVAKGTLR